MRRTDDASRARPMGGTRRLRAGPDGPVPARTPQGGPGA